MNKTTYMAELVRLNKYISESGLCSRREADKYIENGQVRVNGKKADVGAQVNPCRDKVLVNGLAIDPKDKEDMIIMAFNKPVGITSTTEQGVKDSIVDYISYHERIFPIGRLDKDSQGLIFMTNNGDVVNKILRAGNNHEKEYIVTVDKPVTDDFISGMGGGVPILGTMTKKCKVKKEGPYVFNITLVQGLNRQIRRMCEHFGYEVVKLERVRIMNVTLKGIGVGDWKLLEGEELRVLEAMMSDSTSEDITKERKTTQTSKSKASTANGNRSHGRNFKSGSGQRSTKKAGSSPANSKRDSSFSRSSSKSQSSRRGRR